MTKRYRYEAERHVVTHAYLLGVARDACDKAREIENGSFLQTMSSLVFSAFALEAYLNHLGQEKVPFWQEIERIGIMQKLRVLSAHLSVTSDPSARPLQTVRQLFKFRNFMAHGRGEYVTGEGTLPSGEIPFGMDLVQTEWEKYCTLENAERAIEDVRKLSWTLNKAAGFKGNPFASQGTAGRYVCPLEK